MSARSAFAKLRKWGRSARKVVDRRQDIFEEPGSSDNDSVDFEEYENMLVAFEDPIEWNANPRSHSLPQQVFEASEVPLCAKSPHVQVVQLDSLLLRLPVELRHEIFAYCLMDRFVFQPTPLRLWRYDKVPVEFESETYNEFHPWRATYSPRWPEMLHIRPPREYMRQLWTAVSTKPLPYMSWTDLDCVPRSLVKISDRWALDSTLAGLPPHRPLRSFLSWQPWAGPSYSPISTAEQLEYACEDESVARDWSGLSLLLTCRQIYAEAAPLLMQGNTFSFAAPMHLHIFRQHVGKDRFATIRYLHLGLLPGPLHSFCSLDGQIDRPTWIALFRMLARELKALEELDVEMHIAGPDRVSHWVYPRPQGWDMFTIARAQYKSLDLPDWLEELRIFKGRLKCARVLCDSSLIPAFDPRLARLLHEKAYEIQTFITKGGDRWWEALLIRDT